MLSTMNSGMDSWNQSTSKPFRSLLLRAALFFQRQIAVPVFFHGQKIGDFRADLLVDGKVIVELKTGREIEPAWEKQLLNYLRATQIEVGMLFNFGPSAQFKRYVSRMKEKIRDNPRESAEEK